MTAEAQKTQRTKKTTTTKKRKRRSRATGRPPGRPKVDGAVRDRRVLMYMTPDEQARIDQAATTLGIYRADLLRAAIRHYMRHVVPKRLAGRGTQVR